MKRRKFILGTVSASTSVALMTQFALQAEAKPTNVRDEWTKLLLKISTPVLDSAANGQLKQDLPSYKPNRKIFGPLEAFSRTLCGLAPYLVLENNNILLDKYKSATKNLFTPSSTDYVQLEAVGEERQPLVDMAFLAYTYINYPTLYHILSTDTKKTIVESFNKVRTIEPYPSNWLLFSAMVELFLHISSNDGDLSKIENALRQFEKWYAGDGWYGDGEDFHFDYYNSLVIHPFLHTIYEKCDELKMEPKMGNLRLGEKKERILKIAQRHAKQLEMLIMADGSFPAVGRSMAYRTGIFHHLAYMATKNLLPDMLTHGQVRSAMNAAIQKIWSKKDNFDTKNWLTLGLYGQQPGLSDSYIDVGSLYLATTIFMPLGLPPQHPFWTEPDQDWTQKKIWSGADVKGDYYFSQ